MIRSKDIFFKDFIYSFMRDTERKQRQRQREEKQAPHREPDAGLDPRTPGSCPGPKADAQLLSHPGVPRRRVLCSLHTPGMEPDTGSISQP